MVQCRHLLFSFPTSDGIQRQGEQWGQWRWSRTWSCQGSPPAGFLNGSNHHHHHHHHDQHHPLFVFTTNIRFQCATNRLICHLYYGVGDPILGFFLENSNLVWRGPLYFVSHLLIHLTAPFFEAAMKQHFIFPAQRGFRIHPVPNLKIIRQLSICIFCNKLQIFRTRPPLVANYSPKLV